MDRKTRGGLIVLVVVLTVGLMSCFVGGMMGPGVRHGMWGWPLGMGGLGMLLFWGAIVAALYLFSRGRWPSKGEDRSLSPMDIVKRRYAQGEITRDQYEQMRRDLEV